MVTMPRGRLLAYALLATVVAAVGVTGLLRSGAASAPDTAVLVDVTAATAPDPVAADPAGSAPTSTTLPQIYVQVTGAVQRPGVYRLPAGARVYEAVEQAGGATAEGRPDLLPLAALAADGSRIEVPGREADVASATSLITGGSEGAAGQPSTGSAATVSLSRASQEELETLPGVGPKTAERIIAYRTENGPFQTVEDLELVPGIGPATMERLRQLVSP